MIENHWRIIIGALALSAIAAPRLVPQARPAGDGWVGVAVTSGPGSIRVVDVFPGSPADLAGLRIGDTLVAIRNLPATHATLTEVLGRLSPGETVRMLVGRQRRRAVSMKATVRPLAGSGGLSVITIQLDSVRQYARSYLDVARGRLTVFAGPGVQLEQSDTSLILRNDKRGTSIRLDSVLARSQGMREGEARRDSAAGANVQVLKPTTATVWEMVVISMSRSALQSIAGSAATTGLLVVRVDAGGRAARMGVQALDVISEVDGRPVTTVDELRKKLGDTSSGGQRLIVRRGGRQLILGP